jgi:hypothetical protein
MARIELYKVKAALHKDGKERKKIFYIREDTTSLHNQLKFYQMQGYSIRNTAWLKILINNRHPRMSVFKKGSGEADGPVRKRLEELKLESELMQCNMVDELVFYKHYEQPQELQKAIDLLKTNKLLDSYVPFLETKLAHLERGHKSIPIEELEAKLDQPFSEPFLLHYYLEILSNDQDISADSEKVIQHFIRHFVDKGLYDLKTYSESVQSTLFLFFILLDIFPDLFSRCLLKVSSGMDYQSFEFPTTQVIREQQMGYDNLILALLIEPDLTSDIFINNLSLFQNRNLTFTFPELFLLLGDLEQPDILGFSKIESIQKRLSYYVRGTACPRIAEACLFRIVNVMNLLDEGLLNSNKSLFLKLINFKQIQEAIHTLNLRDVNSFMNMLDYKLLSTSIYFQNPIDDHSAETSNSFMRLLEDQFNNLTKGEEHIRDQDVLINCVVNTRYRTSQKLNFGECSSTSDSFLEVAQEDELIQTAQRLVQSGKLSQAIQTLSEMLDNKVSSKSMINALYSATALVKEIELSSEDKSVLFYLEHFKALQVLQRTLYLYLNYFFEKNLSRNGIYTMARLFVESHLQSSEGRKGGQITKANQLVPQNVDTALELLKLMFLLKTEKKDDVMFNRRGIKSMIVLSEKPLQQVNEDILATITEVAMDLTEEMTKNHVQELLRKKIHQQQLFEYDDEEVKLFVSQLKKDGLRDKIKSFLTELDFVLKGKLRSDTLVETYKGLEGMRRLFNMRKIKAGSKEASGAGLEKRRRETELLHRQLLEEVAADEKVRLFEKEEVEVYNTEEGLETFEYNRCAVFRGFLVNNNQKCTIFKMDYGEILSKELIQKLIVYMKLFHPRLLNMYGLMIEINKDRISISVSFVAEFYYKILSKISRQAIKDMPLKAKVLGIFNILSAIETIHTSGVPIIQLNPDLVIVDEKGPDKLIFPFFLPSRLYFYSTFLEEAGEQAQGRLNTLFHLPRLFFRKEEVILKKESCFHPNHAASFAPLAQIDLYSFVLLTAYLLNHDYFHTGALLRDAQAVPYAQLLDTPDKKKKYLPDIVYPIKELGDELVAKLELVYMESPAALSAHALLNYFMEMSKYEYPAPTLDQYKLDMLNNIKFYKNRPARRILVFPCNIRIHTSKNYRDNLCFLNNRLLFQGPLFFLPEGDTFELEVYTNKKEQYQLEFVNGALKQCKVTHKAEQGGQLLPQSLLALNQFVDKTCLFLPNYIDSLIKSYKEISFETWSKLGVESSLNNMSKLAGIREAFGGMEVCFDPFGNVLRVSRDKQGYPLFGEAFTVESYAPHNFSKLLVSNQEKLPGKYLANKVSVLALVDLGSAVTKYAELINEFDNMNVDKCIILSPLGFIYTGSLNFGMLATGKVVDNKGLINAVFKDHFSSGESVINECNMLYRGELAHNKKEGVGLLYRETRREHLTESTRDPSKEEYRQYLYSGEFAEDFPHGRGKLYKANKKIFFMGIFRRGNPVYGMYIADEGYLDGRVLVKVSDRILEEVPPPDRPFLNFVFNPAAKPLTTYIYGFRDADDNSTVLAIVSKEKDLKAVVQNKNEVFLTRDVIYYGALSNGYPTNKGKLLMPDGSKLVGNWNSQERSVRGVLIRKDPVSELIWGTFNYTLEGNNFGFEGYAWTKLDDKRTIHGLYTKDDFTRQLLYRGRSVPAYGAHLHREEAEGPGVR